MSDRNIDPRDDTTFRDVLRRWDAEQAPSVPGFETVRHRIMASPSPLAVPRWSAGRSLRLAGALAWAQVRIVPWPVLPVVLVTVTMAVLTARFFGAVHGASAAASGFTSLLLVGVTVTVTLALSTPKPDAISLSTPLGPQVVVMARVALVLTFDAVAGIAASALITSWGFTVDLPGLLAGWLVPLAVIAGAVTFLAIWVTPWAGVVIGLLLIPLVMPSSDAAMEVGIGALSGALREALSPSGVLGVGIVLLGTAVASARRAATTGVRAA